MANKTMKTLTMNNTTYEIVDEYARSTLSDFSNVIDDLADVARTGSYDDLLDKPFYDATVHLDFADHSVQNGSFTSGEIFYLIAEDVFYPMDQLVGGKIIYADAEYEITSDCIGYSNVFTVVKHPVNGSPVFISCNRDYSSSLIISFNIGSESSQYNVSSRIERGTSVCDTDCLGFAFRSNIQCLEEKFVPDTIARVSQLNWNDLQDKPFYEKVPSIVLDFTDHSTANGDFDTSSSYLVSNDFFTPDQLVGGKIIYDGEEYEVTLDCVGGIDNEFTAVIHPVNGSCVFISCNKKYSRGNRVSFNIGSKSYTWTVRTTSIISVGTSVCDTNCLGFDNGIIHTLDEKFIPDTIARVDQLSEYAYFDTDVEIVEGTSTPLDADTFGGKQPSEYVLNADISGVYVKASVEEFEYGEAPLVRADIADMAETANIANMAETANIANMAETANNATEANNASKLENKSINELFTMLFEVEHPVGSLYLSSSNSDNPNTKWATFGINCAWELVKDVFLLGAGGNYALGGTGGEATHKLTSSEIPDTQVQAAYYANASSADTGSSWTGDNQFFHAVARKIPTTDFDDMISGYSTDKGGSVTYNLSVQGGDQPHNNMPPYLATNIWKRIA